MKQLTDQIPENDILTQICNARHLEALLVVDKRGNFLARNTDGLQIESEALAAYIPVIADADESLKWKLLNNLESHVPGISDNSVSFCQLELEGKKLHILAFGRKPDQRKNAIGQIENLLLDRPGRLNRSSTFNRAS